MANIGSGRVLRVCDLCGGVDDHPRHVIAGTSGGPAVVTAPTDEVLGKVTAAVAGMDSGAAARLLRDLMDTSSSDRHLDCCADAGCPTGTCGPQVADAGGKTGKAMLVHLTTIEDRFADRPDVVMGD